VKILTLTISLSKPILATSLEGEPNSATTLPFIPGGTIRGAFIGKYLAMNGPQDAAHRTFRKLFLNGKVRFLNGYVSVGGQRLLPMPLSWYCEKGQKTPAYDFAVKKPVEDKQWKPKGGGFVVADGSTASNADPDRSISIHNVREPASGRSRKGSGGPFRYEALTSGQKFRAFILCEEDVTALELAALFAEKASVHLGRSGSAEYGEAGIEVAELHTSATSWQEAGGGGPQAAGSTITFTLLSDLLLRNGAGQPAVGEPVFRAAIVEALGCTFEAMGVFFRGTTVGGFNRKWGLPLLQAPAFAMGSVFVYRREGDLDRTKMATLLWQGLGERRDEGFGRVAVDWLSREEWALVEKPPDRRSALSADPLSGHSKEIAQRMVNRRTEVRIEAEMRATAQSIDVHDLDCVSKSQIGRLRLLLRNEIFKDHPGFEGMVAYINSLKARASTKRQWERAYIENTPALEWLQNLLHAYDAPHNPRPASEAARRWREQLGLSEDVGAAIDGIAPQLDGNGMTRWAMVFADAVLAKAAKSRGSRAAHQDITHAGARG
jgi:CRISPR-associated protein Csx10